MQFQLKALKVGRFKKPVIMEVPSEKLNNKGEIAYDEAHFVAEFINIDEAERENYQERLDDLNKQISALPDNAAFADSQKLKKALEKLQLDFIKKFLVSIEKHKDHPFPFLDGKEEFKDISMLLEVRLFKEAINDAYESEVNKKQNEKLNKVLSLNLKR